MIRRCVFCTRRIWPWQRMGWRVGVDHTDYWHPACKRVVDKLVHEAVDELLTSGLRSA